MKILVLGANGMLGNAMVRVLSENADWQVHGTIRAESTRRLFKDSIAKRLISGVDVENNDSLLKVFIQVRPDVVINCVGLIKQLSGTDEPLHAIPMNALLPHRLARLCQLSCSRLIHLSTDCVFSGDKGGYCESDPSDATDLYGKSKFLGEVAYYNTITLRSSIIGHELQTKNGLLGWFLHQQGQCSGYVRAIFSGLPTVVLSQMIRDVVIPRNDLSGLYHVAAQPISKFDLLKLIAEIYGKQIEIIPNNSLVIDRSLNAGRFLEATGYVVPSWPEMIKIMYTFK